MAFPVHLYRALARDRAPFGIDAQAALIRAHRRDRGRPHLQPAGVYWRTTQLGLSVHLDSRRRLYTLRPAARRLHRGGHALSRLAEGPLAGLRERPRRSSATDVRHRRTIESS